MKFSVGEIAIFRTREVASFFKKGNGKKVKIGKIPEEKEYGDYLIQFCDENLQNELLDGKDNFLYCVENELIKLKTNPNNPNIILKEC